MMDPHRNSCKVTTVINSKLKTSSSFIDRSVVVVIVVAIMDITLLR